MAFGNIGSGFCDCFVDLATDLVVTILDARKAGFVLLLIIYHLKCHQLFRKLQKDKIEWSSNKMRLFNEGSTIILFSVIFLMMLRNALNWVFGLIGLLLLIVILMLGYKIYKRTREKNQE